VNLSVVLGGKANDLYYSKSHLKCLIIMMMMMMMVMMVMKKFSGDCTESVNTIHTGSDGWVKFGA
jgi:hypothetical protein